MRPTSRQKGILNWHLTRRETYFELHGEATQPRFDYTITYYDPDRKFEQVSSVSPLTLSPLKANPALESLANPFSPGQEVRDSNMFVGRGQR